MGIFYFNKKIAKTPAVFQMEATECGAACLSMVLGYYERYIPLEQLREDCGISRDGSKASNIVMAAEKHGLISEGYNLEFDELDSIELPAIVFWRYNHYVVLEGFKNNKAYINDPANGRASVSREEFIRNYSNVVLTFEPGDSFEKYGKPFSVIPQIYKRLVKHKKPLLYIFLAGLGFSFIGLLVPIFSRIFVDQFLVNRLDSIIKPLLIGMLLTVAMRWGLSFIQNHYLMKLEIKLSSLFSSEMLWHLLQLPIQFFYMRHTGDIVERMSLNQNVSKFIVNVYIESVLNAIFVVVYALLLLYYDSSFMLVASAIAAINLIILYKISNIRHEKNLLLSYDLGNYYGHAYSGFRIIESIKASSQESGLFAKVFGSQVKASNTIHELSKKTIIYNALPTILNGFNVAIILVLGASKVMDGSISIGTLVAIQSLVISYIVPLNKLVVAAASISDMSGKISKLDDILNYKQRKKINIQELADTASLAKQQNARLSGLIEIKNVTFGYNCLERALVHDISLSIVPGEHVAIVGASGAGKSTFAKLLSNLYEPWSGEIAMDGQNISQIHRLVLVNSLSLVEQDNVMLNFSIKDNITMWDDTLRHSDLVQAAKDALIHDDISLRKNGYDAEIYQQGTNFSGGQRQRLDIARALVTNPSILIMDEATSELDPITESEIYNNIRRRGCTTIIIAHRLSTIRNADKIVVLDKGRIVQLGTHEELIAQPGVYNDLMQME